MGKLTFQLLAFYIVGIGFILVRFYFRLKKRRMTGSETPAESNSRESKANFILRRYVFVPILVIVIIFNFVNPSWFRFSLIPLPLQVIIRAGLVVGITGLILLIWVHSHLGKEWSVSLQVNDDHRLIKTGPYARVRHPMYTALFLVYLGLGIITANYVVLLLIILSIVSIYRRIPQEEEMMIGKFGEEYRNYMKETGRLLPKL